MKKILKTAAVAALVIAAAAMLAAGSPLASVALSGAATSILFCC